MNCNQCRETADRYAAAADDERRQLHSHMAGCSRCREYFDGFQRCTSAFQSLGRIDGAQARTKIRGDLDRRAHAARRQAAWAAAGMVVAAVAAFWFIAQGEPFGYFALVGTSVVMGWTVWRSRQVARTFVASTEDSQMLAQWRSDVRKQLHHTTMVGPLIATGFAVLSAIVVARHGLFSLKGLVYSLTFLGIIAYVVRQWLVVRPRLRTELALIEEDHAATS